ncbi:NB-ARC domain-containing protein [Plantactinospora sp. WMMB782]|uniref:NB-ARC domain-containing protein n=1 Tax=Plantactinospora sp. WMMB782 TaxID=3404121 RepID=UPI003B92A692
MAAESDGNVLSLGETADTPVGGPSPFGTLLLQYRRAAGMSQAQLAQASGMSTRALRDLERGRARAAYRRSADVLADALGLAGGNRELFLIAARVGRRRTPRGWDETASCSLPPGIVDRVGREPELEWLRTRVEAGRLVAVVGYPGVGKTAVAVAAAHRLAPVFPGGCLAVDLHGTDERPIAASEALGRLLSALGMSADRMPVAVAERSILARTLLHGRRMLVLLDDAATEDQVRPLLVAGRDCSTLITSRPTLAGLESVRRLWLRPLIETESVCLLAHIVGAGRVDAEPEAAMTLARLCGGLPLALRIVGNRLATRPNWTIAAMVRRLGDHRSRLSTLRAGDLQALPTFDLSYRRLSVTAQMVFRRIALLPQVEFGDELAAVATNLSTGEVRAHLDELAYAGLLRADPAMQRIFQFNDLLKAFARQQLTEIEGQHVNKVLRDALLDRPRASRD